MKFSYALTIFLVLSVSVLYFFVPGIGAARMVDNKIFETMELKAVVEEKEIKLFAHTSNNALAMLATREGFSIPEENAMVIGSNEAEMMVKNDLIKKSGDKLYGFFGIDTQVGGIYKKTDTMIDHMHFLSKNQFKELDGVSNVFIGFNEGMPKLFFTYKNNDDFLKRFEFSSGNLENYRVISMNGKTLYPIVLGYDEAEMMISEKLFTDAGDKIEGFFGKDVFIAGILKKTDSGVDMMHFIPLGKGDLK
ncbi:MAG: hypothetical protein NDI94_06240 [Candidatus Woesearchaeota archaeon]|nr:hypothetical protein [Candidatus Woesearchaeota archaeon]